MVEFTSFVYTLTSLIGQYFPEEIDPSLKPIDTADCFHCRQLQFDFIIVGAGSAGSVLANRLSENENWKILIIEAGDDEDHISDVPALQTNLFNTRFDWNFTTVQQRRACLDKNGFCELPQGHVMGGTSAINTMRYVRGNRADFDEWEATGNYGWNYNNILPYFRKAENVSTTDLMYSYYRSTSGPMVISYSNYDEPVLREFLRAGQEFGLETLDYNGEQQIGINYFQNTMKDGTTRCSASKAYLEPIRYRKNLYIFKNTLVKRMIFNEISRTVIGVECLKNGKQFNVLATKEVIITAGAINTPKLLMLSGVGPRKHLEAFGIPVIADLPVGEALYDHIYVPMKFAVNRLIFKTYDEFSHEAIVDYAKYRRGMLTTPNGVEMVAFMNQYKVKHFPPDVEIMMGTPVTMETSYSLTIPYFILGLFNLKPKSRGTVRLQSWNFLDPPLIDPNYFANLEDIEITKWAIRELFQFPNTPTMAKYNMKWITTDAERYCGNLDYNDDVDLECYIKYLSQSIAHPVGTCKMGDINDRSSVVDFSTLKVHGIANLRLAGSPIFPSMIRGHPNAVSIMTAEKLSDILITRYR
ncbi:glucose dehydrogenase [FAD, quinone]-like [Rhodnius prolixus]|uniref:glucose dehydrogenase [FAD, quinone]-like n=1 Tax=Rhodnius prolixus TaxID=13249 RepID=UPI003D18CA69